MIGAVTEPPAFRHDPRKSVLVVGDAKHPPVRWTAEPAICGFQRLDHQSSKQDRPIPVPICATPAVITGAGVVVGSYDGRVRFYNRCLDKVYWERRLDASIYASLVIDHARRNVLVGSIDGLVACFDLRGTLVWSSRLEGPVYATPTVLPEADLAVLTTFGSRCVGLDLGTGRQVFQRELPQPWQAGYGGSAAYRDPYASPVGTPGGTVVVGCAEHVICLATDGTELWRQDLGHAVRASPAILAGSDEVLVCAVDGGCRFLDLSTGEQRGEVELGAKVIASPAVSGAICAIGTVAGRAFGVSADQHRIVWESAIGAPHDHTSFTVLPTGDFAATGSQGDIVALRCSDGGFLWQTSQLLGLAEHDPAMHITPMAGPDGSMYCGSYSGVVYHFRFAPQVVR